MLITPRWFATHFSFLILFALLGIGLPLYLCMPLWADVTYHDISARNVLEGGIHYRDVFETNFPGMVWIQAVVRTIVGWSSEAIRAVDFLIFSAELAILFLFIRAAGYSLLARTWFLIGGVFYYLYQTELIHCQRDGWMLFPALLATAMRYRQQSRDRVSLGNSFLQGCLWGTAVWIKPHCLVPAFVVWLGSLRGQSQKGRDFLGLLLGGSLMGILGSSFLIATGTWPHLWDILLVWNPEYYEWSLAEMMHRFQCVPSYFSPWSMGHLLAIPLAVQTLIRAWRRDPTGTRLDVLFVTLLYAGWLTQAVFLQKAFHYANSPALILSLAVLTVHRIPAGFIFFVWCLFGFAGHSLRSEWPQLDQQMKDLEETRPETYRVLFPEHALFDQERLAQWERCWTENSSIEVKDKLSFYHGWIHCVPGWDQLDAVEQFLREKNLKDGELVCWYDSTHPLYLSLGLKPGVRFIHVLTVMDFQSKHQVMMDELRRSGHRYVVSDLMTPAMFIAIEDWSFLDTHCSLPKDFPDKLRSIYPWNQPIVFRKGRYLVHEVTQPIEQIEFREPRKR